MDQSSNAVELLRQAVAIPSLSGQETAVAEFLVAQMQASGYSRAFIDPAGNAVGEMGPADADHTLVMLGHMDTVPGQPPVRLAGGKLYGRGSVDAKGPLCTFIAATARVGVLPGWRFVVVGAVEEESATSKGARFIRDRFLAEGVPDACVIGEPSGWDRLTLGYKGRLLVDFHAETTMGHTAGENAVGIGDAAVRWWTGVKTAAATFNATEKGAFAKILPSLRTLNTGSDGLRDWVDAKVGLRLPVGLDIAELREQLTQLAEHCGGAVHFYGYEAAYRGPKNTPLVSAFLPAIRQHGGRPGFKVKTGTSDMNVVGPAWGVPILAYGPGDSRLDHTPQEHVEVVEYLRAVDILATALRRLAGA